MYTLPVFMKICEQKSGSGRAGGKKGSSATEKYTATAGSQCVKNGKP